MPLHAMRFAPTLTACLLATATMAVADRASAAPPSGDQFEIRYFTTDADGNRSRQMTAIDLQSFVNQARCECGQSISTRIRLSNMATDLDPVQIRTFAGNRCDDGEVNLNNPMVRPCALLYDAFTNAYTRNVDVDFNPLWLSTGVSRDSPTRDVNSDDIVAAGSCERGQGNGGVWICVENGMQTNCQPDEFVVNGTQNLNTMEGEMGMGIRFDFEPPLVTVANPRVSAGDGAIEVSWDVTSTGAIDGGFRLLCATADGQPVPGKGFELSSVTAQNMSTIYFTRENLCPDGPFDEVVIDPDSTSGTFPGTTGGTDGGTGDTDFGTGGDFGTTSFGVFGDEPDPQHGIVDCCASKMSPGCSNPGCQARVCDGELDPCCTESWTQQCADEAIDECFVCGGPATCCTASGTPGCGDDFCEQQVCIDTPECCKVAWDASCVAAAQLVCDACMDDSTSGDTTPGTDVTGATTPATTTATATDGTASGTDTDGAIDSPIGSLDWAYVCSGYIAPAASGGRITGLQNGAEYQVLVVAYDKAGNPAIASDVLTAIPRETTDLWEQCEMQGGICGEGGFCKCTAGRSTPDDDAAWLLLLALFGVRRRSRAVASRSDDTRRRGPARQRRRGGRLRRALPGGGRGRRVPSLSTGRAAA